MKVYVNSLRRERDAACNLELTVLMYGTPEEIERFRESLHFCHEQELEPLRVKRDSRTFLIDKTVVIGGVRVADCTTKEAAEAALRLLK